MSNVDSPTRRVWPRLTLRTIGTLILVLCLAIALWQTSQELGRARNELRGLHEAVGQLVVENESKINYTMVRSGDLAEWRWRIKPPKGKRLWINYSLNDIHEDGWPESAYASQLIMESDEMLLTVRCVKDHHGDWQLVAATTLEYHDDAESRPFQLKLFPKHRAWLEGDLDYVWDRTGFGGKTTTVPADEPAQLLRLRIVDENGEVTDNGILIWLTEKPAHEKAA
jgi:hypothetical protein